MMFAIIIVCEHEELDGNTYADVVILTYTDDTNTIVDASDAFGQLGESDITPFYTSGMDFI